MDAIERAIRAALEKGDAEDRAFREKVYRSVLAALDKAIDANPSLPRENAHQRRAALLQTVRRVETEFMPAVAAPAVPVSPPDLQVAENDVETVLTDDASLDISPALDRSPPGSARDGGETARMRTDRAAEGPSYVAPVAETREVRRRSRAAAYLFIAATVVAGLVIGGWWTYQQGLFLTPEQRDTAVRTAPPILEAEEFTPEDAGSGPAPTERVPQDENWIVIFAPDDPASVTAPAGAEATIEGGDAGQFMRVRSGSDGSAVLFDIGQGVLEQIAGRRALFNIVARSQEGEPTQISVTCNFGELGDCGRNRYDVGLARADYLFDLQMPSRRPGAGGTIAIVTDVERQGRAIELFTIRVTVAQ